MLSDKKIMDLMKEEEIIIKPFKRENLGPNSYDLTLSKKAKFIAAMADPFDLTSDNIIDYMEISLPFVLKPGRILVFMTNEIVGCKTKTLGIISQRSSLARLPLVINFSNLLDTGFVGVLSGAMINQTDFNLYIKPDIRILQIMFESVDGEVKRRYDERKWSKNLNQLGFEVPEFKVDKEWRKEEI